ncbi:MAG: sialidase family protein [Lentisphaeria bacterium]
MFSKLFCAAAIFAFSTCNHAQDFTTSRVFTTGEAEIPHFRIPTIVTTKAGSVLAFAEGRYHATDHGRNDIVMKRSTDNGATWSELIKIHSDSELVMLDPSPVALNNGRIILFYQTFPWGYHNRNLNEHGIRAKMLETGFTPGKTQQLIMRYSDDDGKTWSAPRYLEKISRDEIAISSGSPTNGIQLNSKKFRNRVVMPIFTLGLNDKNQRVFRNCVMYSDNFGKTWTRGNFVPEFLGDESLLVELENGDIMMHARPEKRNAPRVTAISKDGGATWSSFENSNFTHRNCNAGMISFRHNKQHTMIFSYNDSMARRSNGTIYASLDNGKTWPYKKVLVPGMFGYSQLTKLKNDNIGIIYEPFESPRQKWNIEFISLPINELIK